MHKRLLTLILVACSAVVTNPTRGNVGEPLNQIGYSPCLVAGWADNAGESVIYCDDGGFVTMCNQGQKCMDDAAKAYADTVASCQKRLSGNAVALADCQATAALDFTSSFFYCAQPCN